MVIRRKRCSAPDPFGWDNTPLKCKRTVSSVVLIIINFSFEGVTPSSQQMKFPPSPPSPPLLTFLLIARTLRVLPPHLLINAGINMPESWGAGSSAGNLALQVSVCVEHKDLAVHSPANPIPVSSLMMWETAASRAWEHEWAFPTLALGK